MSARPIPPPPRLALTGRTVAIVAAGAALVVIVALVVLLGGREAAATTGAPAGEAPAQPAPAPGDTGPEPAGEGSLADMVQPAVGDLRLDESSLQQVPSLIGDDATDALQMSYDDAAGGRVYHLMMAFASPEAAAAHVVRAAEAAEAEGSSAGEPFEVVDQQERVIGVGISMSTPDGQEVVLWSNDALYLLAAGPPGLPAAFYSASGL